MKTFFYTILVLILCQTVVFGQIEQTTHGSGYHLQTYYNLETGESTSVDILSWDIAFTTSGHGAGVLINEGVPSTVTPVGEVQLYYKEGLTWESQDTSGKVRFFNDEESWDKGAFNTVLNPGNPFDLGWGAYNPVNHSITGEKIFLLKLRNDSWRKINIQSLISGVFTFEVADLDGGNRSVKSLSKSDFAGRTLAYYSFGSDSFQDLEPAQWDLLFTRYSTPLDNGGELLDYQVTGTLANSGIEVVKAAGIDPATVDYQDYIEDLSGKNNIIGHDWKHFDLSSFQWIVPLDLVYFIKSRDNKLWQIHFLDFEGSSTGIVTLEKTFLTTITSVAEHYKDIQSLEVFPNPAGTSFTIAFELREKPVRGRISIINMNGVRVYHSQETLNSGLNILNMDMNLSGGVYHVVLETEKETLSRKLIIAR